MVKIPTDTTVDENGIMASVWVQRGGMIVQRYALDYDDPDSYWRLWWDKFKEVLPDDLVQKIWGEPLSDNERLMIHQKLSGKRCCQCNELY